MYRYILRESCSQFDSLPLTYLTISQFDSLPPVFPSLPFLTRRLNARTPPRGHAHTLAPTIDQAVNPPEMKSIEASLASLRSLQALDESRGDRLTPLGYHLALLPVEPRLGKIIVLACIFGCLAPALTIAGECSFFYLHFTRILLTI